MAPRNRRARSGASKRRERRRGNDPSSFRPASSAPSAIPAVSTMRFSPVVIVGRVIFEGFAAWRRLSAAPGRRSDRPDRGRPPSLWPHIWSASSLAMAFASPAARCARQRKAACARRRAKRPGGVIVDVGRKAQLRARHASTRASRSRLSRANEAPLAMAPLRPGIGVEQIDARRGSSSGSQSRTSAASP